MKEEQKRKNVNNIFNNVNNSNLVFKDQTNLNNNSNNQSKLEHSTLSDVNDYLITDPAYYKKIFLNESNTTILSHSQVIF